ncbi:MAG: hypothetical protein KQJ78_04130 [Deltaproteobacteria bacterium]|nr:hypothetical protein [Deltaproteobacteria bacterium]
MIELRSFALIDRLQRQFVSFIGSTARGYYPVAGQSAMFVEIAPGLSINSLCDAVMKQANVRPGALVVERTYGMMEVHADSPADVELAGQVILDFLDVKIEDRAVPKILASETIERIDPYMTQIINRFRNSSMSLSDETLYILEMEPAGYAGFAANEAEKAADVTLVHVTVYGATGRLYLSGTHSNVAVAREAAEAALGSITGKSA